ncbi:hypothetical protein CTM86_07080 [Fusobacterium pseudoperiodonticum]|uniref:Uncharacterized protein n=1 Tax=Fusobacterium pseudoperiodonticum TaxID=2663009 RepID=A0AAD0F471_9FUSO|nr:hypothetical protein [Fusobacterium pseudoperiodonticum]ATV66371.1 hypothetical protein CTM86_07080 [Fusobacterium pseudoperiodonticum]
MKGFYIYIAVMAVVMAGYSIVLLTMTKKRKKDVQEWLEQNPKAAKVYIGSTSSNLLSYILTPSSISLIAIDNKKPKTFTMEGTKQVFYLTPGKHTITSSFQKSRPGILSKRVITEYEPTTQEVEVEAEKTYIYSFDKKNEQYTFTEKN